MVVQGKRFNTRTSDNISAESAAYVNQGKIPSGSSGSNQGNHDGANLTGSSGTNKEFTSHSSTAQNYSQDLIDDWVRAGCCCSLEKLPVVREVTQVESQTYWHAPHVYAVPKSSNPSFS
eukprot:gnl/MRDRNA2_/MRDRNA2_241457_c0_seq1.p2 gnl/MRDRNA2_/MRDRNA2_241457_c0~~gnl/MRDRNA2_/MRDRNA2_241457_c0_seq1.p2  ORF type:complete len:135 (+),score=12.44 gnl/MRDRNA2_/MRDRNA2_241457_c0_seq1:50-406(+)